MIVKGNFLEREVIYDPPEMTHHHSIVARMVLIFVFVN
jgi:hypothetical protein